MTVYLHGVDSVFRPCHISRQAKPNVRSLLMGICHDTAFVRVADSLQKRFTWYSPLMEETKIEQYHDVIYVIWYKVGRWSDRDCFPPGHLFMRLSLVCRVFFSFIKPWSLRINYHVGCFLWTTMFLIFESEFDWLACFMRLNRDCS